MHEYIVAIPLESGYTMHILVAAADETEAKFEVRKMLDSVGVRALDSFGAGHYAADDIRVSVTL